jgi:lipoyl(octanoyl) transferase
MSDTTLTATALGPVSYAHGLRLQEGLVEARAAGRIGDRLLFPDHPPVLTMGRGGDRSSLRVDPATLAARGIELFEVARGGDVTWHGPGQLVGYTIFDLCRRDRDLHRFLRDLEQVMIDALAASASRRSARTDAPACGRRGRRSPPLASPCGAGSATTALP